MPGPFLTQLVLRVVDDHLAAVLCTACGETWTLPASWALDHQGEHVPCPHCAVVGALPPPTPVPCGVHDD